MAEKTITLDFERINSTFQQAVPEFKMKLDQKAAKDLLPAALMDKAAVGFLGIPGTEKIDLNLETACSAWPKVRGLLNTLLRIGGWMGYNKDHIALAKGFLTMLDMDVVPQFCAVDASPAAKKIIQQFGTRHVESK